MKTILVPVDGSQHSVRALETAFSWSKDLGGAKIHVITVQVPIASGNIKRYFSTADIEAYYQDEGQKALEPVRHLVDHAGVTCTVKVLVGQVAETIVEYAEKHACDQIVMGTRGLSHITGLVLGSIATKVIHLANTPVTVVK